jgi:hypothetical protein
LGLAMIDLIPKQFTVDWFIFGRQDFCIDVLFPTLTYIEYCVSW